MAYGRDRGSGSLSGRDARSDGDIADVEFYENVFSDEDGNNNNMSISITGGYNQTHTEIGNGGDNDNDISVTIDNGDDNYIYSEVINGDYNTIDTQIHKQDDGYIKVTVKGNSNDIKAWQGKHEAGNVDADETGNNDVYWIVSGSNNTLESYQTDDNNNGGLHIANYITGDSNDVKHTQRGGGAHRGFIEITGDSNDVTLLQRGNTNTQFADFFDVDENWNTAKSPISMFTISK